MMGKENYERFKAVVFAFVGRIKPAGNVSALRHNIGLAMFFIGSVRMRPLASCHFRKRRMLAKTRR